MNHKVPTDLVDPQGHDPPESPPTPVSPRRKPGSIDAGLWNMDPGFRRGDSRDCTADASCLVRSATEILSDEPHVQRRQHPRGSAAPAYVRGSSNSSDAPHVQR